VTEIAVIGYPSEGNFDFVAGLRAAGVDASLLSPYAAKELSVGDVGLVRLDVLRTLDGVEDGLEVMADLERRGIRIVNPPVSLLATHDKLRTYALLAAAGILIRVRSIWSRPRRCSDCAHPSCSSRGSAAGARTCGGAVTGTSCGSEPKSS